MTCTLGTGFADETMPRQRLNEDEYGEDEDGEDDDVDVDGYFAKNRGQRDFRDKAI